MKKEKKTPKKRLKKSVIIKRVITTVLILAVLGGVVWLGFELYKPEPEQANKPTVTRINYDVEPATYVIANEDLELTLYRDTTQFTLKEKKTGRVWNSNPGDLKTGELKDPNGVAIGASKINDMRSTLIVSYSSSSADKDLNNWEYSIDKQAYTIEKVELEDGTEAIEVHYSVGQMSGVSKIPTVLTAERYKELFDRIKNSADSNTKSLRNTLSSNFKEKTMRELIEAKDVKNRLLGAHVLLLSFTQKALENDDYEWVRDTITALNNASIVAFDPEATQAMLDEHTAELEEILGDQTKDFLAKAVSEDYEERREAANLLADQFAEEEKAEAAEQSETLEAEPEPAWHEQLVALIERPTVEPVDLEAVKETIQAHTADFFGDKADEVEELIALIDSDEHADKKTAADRITDKVADAEMAKESNAWAVALIEALEASGAEDYDSAAVAEMVRSADEDPDRKAVLDRTFFIGDSLLRNAKDNLTKALYGDERTEGINYTAEEYLEDAEWELPAEENLTVLFEVTMRYRLDGPDFVVEIPYERIKYNKEAPITYITVLPMFGAAGPDQYDHGFIFVPEGGGALINYNNGKLKQNYYTANLYGWDYSTKRSEAISETKNTFPVFGMTNNGSSFICIIEEGSAHAIIKADINGQGESSSAFHPNSYNTACAKYHVLHSDQYNVSAKTANMVIMYEKEMPQETVVQRYRFIGSDNYVDMATTYGDYLRERYPSMAQADASEDMPVTVELVGAIDKRVVTAGLPVQRVLSTTTFDQMKTIIGVLSDKGVKELHVRVSGWANGGVTQQVLTGVRVEGAVGGDGGMKSLIAYAKEKGVDLYFDGITAFAYDPKFLGGFTPRADAARYTTREIVEITPYSQIYYTEDDERDVYYLTRPEYAQKNASNLIKALKDRGAGGVSFRDIGYLLSGNYDPNNTTTREAVKKMNIATLQEAHDNGERVMIREGFDYAMPYADIITDMDLNGIDYSLLDASVPFYQIAIHGSVNYTGPALNQTSDWKTELLRCAEYGAGLNFTFMYEDAKIVQDTVHSAYHGSTFSSWEEAAVAEINRYQTEMAGLNRTAITGHIVLPLEVSMTEYADGTRVYVNYGDRDYTLPDGRTIPARDYAVLRDDTTDLQAVVEANGTRSFVNYTAATYTAGDTKVLPRSTTKVRDGRKADVIFLGEGTRLYVNADSEPITVADGQTVQPGESLRVTDDMEFEVIFTSDGERTYVNYTDADMLAGGVTVPAMGYARVSDPIALDAVVIKPGPVEAAADESAEAEPAEPLYRVVWVNATDEPVTVAGETVAARSYQWSDSKEPVIVYIGEADSLYVNRTAAELTAGANKIPASNSLTVSNEQPLDVIFLGGEAYARIYVNKTDADIDANGTAVPAGSVAEAQLGDTVEVIFLPDGSRMVVNYTGAIVKAGSRNIAASNYLLETEPPAIDTVVLSETEGEATVNSELWINGTETALVIDGTEIPAGGWAKVPVGEAALQIVVLPDGTVRVFRHTAMPPQVKIGSTNVQGNNWADMEALEEAPDVEGLVRIINLTDAEVTVGGVTLGPGEISPAGGEPEEAPPGEGADAPVEASEEGGDAK